MDVTSLDIDSSKLRRVVGNLFMELYEDPLGAVRRGWDTIKPGGAWHPSGFIEHKGHLVLEGLMMIIIARFMLQGSSKPRKTRMVGEGLTEDEINELCREWEPEPFRGGDEFQKTWMENTPTISSHAGRTMTVNGVDGVLDFCTTNFLGLADEKRVEDAGQATMDKYGVGSCGPRGFYGTIDVHLDLEKHLSEFMKTEEAIFIRCTLSRAKVFTFKHNDVGDLEKTLAKIVAEEKRLKKPLNRRFVVVEGLYHNTGDIAPLRDIVV
eukprot:jgi/Picre1/29707/NNA_005090.t1